MNKSIVEFMRYDVVLEACRRSTNSRTRCLEFVSYILKMYLLVLYYIYLLELGMELLKSYCNKTAIHTIALDHYAKGKPLFVFAPP